MNKKEKKILKLFEDSTNIQGDFNKIMERTKYEKPSRKKINFLARAYSVGVACITYSICAFAIIIAKDIKVPSEMPSNNNSVSENTQLSVGSVTSEAEISSNQTTISTAGSHDYGQQPETSKPNDFSNSTFETNEPIVGEPGIPPSGTPYEDICLDGVYYMLIPFNEPVELNNYYQTVQEYDIYIIDDFYVAVNNNGVYKLIEIE